MNKCAIGAIYAYVQIQCNMVYDIAINIDLSCSSFMLIGTIVFNYVCIIAFTCSIWNNIAHINPRLTSQLFISLGNSAADDHSKNICLSKLSNWGYYHLVEILLRTPTSSSAADIQSENFPVQR